MLALIPVPTKFQALYMEINFRVSDKLLHSEEYAGHFAKSPKPNLIESLSSAKAKVFPSIEI